jgi:hypothetical protein
VIEVVTAKVYKGARRRYFTKEAAARSFGRAAIMRHCECEPATHGEPGYTCTLHLDVERYARLVEYIAKRKLRSGLGEPDDAR